MLAQNLQEDHYDEEIDYRHGSPHLAHWWLYERLVGRLRQQVQSLATSGLPLKVLEIGAGHGGFTEPALAAGCDVTAIEMSRPSMAVLEARFGANPGFTSLHSPEGRIPEGGRDFSLLLCVSVLHHIPDYVSFLEEGCARLMPGGAILTLQDPLWYDRVDARALRLGRAAYLTWRLRQGDLRRGLATQVRRRRGVYDEQNPADMVEYHVVRKGVDEQAIVDTLEKRCESVNLLTYWSTQAAVAQRMGERLGLANTFGVVATGVKV